ncbi:MAG TPA: hypothetical protein V6C96_02710 [Vampirovibrionales bacterium]
MPDEEDVNEQELIKSLTPWKKSPIGFGIDVCISILTYILSYVFLFNLGAVRRGKLLEDIKSHIPEIKEQFPHISEKTFEDTVLKLAKFDSHKELKTFYKEYYDPYIEIKKKKNEISKFELMKERVFRTVFGNNKEMFMSMMVSSFSLLRAYAVHPNLSPVVAAFIGLTPFCVNGMFLVRNKIATGDMPIKFLSKLNVKSLEGFAESTNFTIKVLSKALKRTHTLLMFVVALTGSLISRIVREVLDDGLPHSGKPHRVPLMRKIGELKIVKKLRALGSDGLQNGFADRVKRPETISKGWTKYLVKHATLKGAFKYASDFSIFSLCVGVLELIYWARHKWKENHNSSLPVQPVYTNTFSINGLTGTSDSNQNE